MARQNNKKHRYNNFANDLRLNPSPFNSHNFHKYCPNHHYHNHNHSQNLYTKHSNLSYLSLALSMYLNSTKQLQPHHARRLRRPRL